MLRRVLCLALAAAPLALSGLPARAAGPASATEDGTCPPLLRHTPLRLQDELPQPLCQYRNKVLLVVNTASYCGFTGQYQGLEALHARYKDRGLVVLGFPSNDFSQEGGSNAQIADFCESTFGVKFPMFAKSRVVGADASPLYRELKAQAGEAPRWNFHKYLVGRDGKVAGSFASVVEPGDPRLVRAIEQQLDAGRPKPSPF
ncbi:glutathione peroxidase [Acidovorax sp. SUPP3434]|uniref:glutathione peroxidase n=1 Tax=Acidovorax sp. SUPP3434 TaxID=2920880 RepID=UPI0023DE2FC1|nr:glutathione peroxidase [Acidovorax sp. SUPP3434]GKT00727.1 glutathione peroxidase [Acidovorax sp. SUPP3434]